MPCEGQVRKRRTDGVGEEVGCWVAPHIQHLKKIIIICYKLLIFILTNDYMIVTNSLFTCLEKVVKGVTRGSLTA